MSERRGRCPFEHDTDDCTPQCVPLGEEQGQANARRGRYAAAIGATDINNAHVIRLAADAAMAVADAEIRVAQAEAAPLVAGQYEEENDRLHDLIEDLEDDVRTCNIRENERERNALRAELTALHQQCSDDREDALREREGADAEIDRLRADLEEMNKASEFADIRREKAEDTLSRVRSVLDAADLNDRETGFYMDIRAALETPEED